MRLIFGLGQSILIPSTTTSVARMFGPTERASAIGTAMSGGVVGLAVGATVTAFIVSRSGWHAAFYWLGGGSLLLTLFWFCFFPDKRIGEVSAKREDEQRISGFSLLRYRSTWGISLGLMGYLYAYFFFVTWLPGYLVIQRHMTIMNSGLVASLPFWLGMVGTLGGGWLGDYLTKRGVSTMVSRKSIIGAALGASTVFVIAAAYVEQSWLAVALICLCMGSLRMATGSAYSLPIDLAHGSVVGKLTSLQSLIGNIGGLMAPIATGYIVSATGSFTGALVAAGAMASFGAVCFIFLTGDLETGRIEPQKSKTNLSEAPLPLSRERAG
jgi:predicted MFS family arabinose efflux permease